MKAARADIALIFIVAIVLRLLFSFHFQQFYFGELTFKYADTSSYLKPILNLIDNGEYIGDKYMPDSRFFRPPVYPLFLGILHILSPGDLFDYVVASIQCLLGASSAVLVYCCIENITKTRRAAQFSGYIFACYPFAILWTPILYTETLQLFFITSLLFIGTSGRITVLSAAVQGLLIGFIVLTKQYLGLIVLIPICIILLATGLNNLQKMAQVVILALSFFFVLSPWVIRNYIASGNIIVLFSKTSGLRFVLDDMIAFTHFANKFDENITENVESVAYVGKISLLTHSRFVVRYKKDIDDAVLLAYQCGGSFQEWRKKSSPEGPPYPNCNDDVASKFNWLSEQFWKEVPFWEALESRRDSLRKILSKSDLVNSSLAFNANSLAKYILFKYRVFLLLLGLAGIFYILIQKNNGYYQKKMAASLLITSLIFYAFFCLIMVQAEVRYLLTPDVLLTIFAGIIPAALVSRINPRKRVKADYVAST